ETGDPRLGDLDLGLAYPEPVTDADLVVGQSVDGEVLAERAVLEAVEAEELLPAPVRVGLVHQYGAPLTTVPGQVAVSVAVDVQAAHHPRAVDRLLPDAGVHGPAVPRDVLRHPDVDGEKARHRHCLALGLAPALFGVNESRRRHERATHGIRA